MKKVCSILLISLFLIGCVNYKTTEGEAKNITTLYSRDNKDENYTYKYEYLAKLDDIEEGLGNKDSMYEEESVLSMIDIKESEADMWNDMLNDIYFLLRTQLNEDEFKVFENKHIEWINYREKVAQEDADKFEGMVFAKVQYNITLSKITKERCYELVNLYL